MNAPIDIVTERTTILAIDLGKYKSVACRAEQSTGEYRFTTFDTSRTELHKLLAKERPAVVIIEACLLAGWVRDLCGELGVHCLVANTGRCCATANRGVIRRRRRNRRCRRRSGNARPRQSNDARQSSRRPWPRQSRSDDPVSLTPDSRLLIPDS